MIACEQDQLDAVTFLLASGASVHLKDHSGRCALLEACDAGHRSIVDILLKTGAHFVGNDPVAAECHQVYPSFLFY